MDDLTAQRVDKEMLQALRDLAEWALEDRGAEPGNVPSLAKALAIIDRIDGAQPELDLDEIERTLTSHEQN